MPLVSVTSFISYIITKRYFLNLFALDLDSDFLLIEEVGFWYILLPYIVHYIILGSAKDNSLC
jgi:hypothetical protein